MKDNNRFLYKVLILVGIIFSGLSIGTIGYVLIEGWSVFDSLYMTVITTATVGFLEVHELSTAGRVFTMFLIFFSVGTIAYAISNLTHYIASGEYRIYIKNYRQIKQLGRMENHVIICGFGRVGKQVAEDLIAHHIQVVVIENSREIIEKNQSDQVLFIEGDASQDEIIELAKLQKARAFIACLPKDADNLYAILAVKELRNDIMVLARASNHHAISKLKRAGANNVIMPDVIGGSHIAALVSNPDVMEFMENIKAEGLDGINIKSIDFSELPNEFQNKTIKDLEGNKITGVTIIGYKSPEGEYIINPDSNIIVCPHSKLFVLGNAKQISRFVEFFHLS
jgi:voltage-gated potassium channel